MSIKNFGVLFESLFVWLKLPRLPLDAIDKEELDWPVMLNEDIGFNGWDPNVDDERFVLRFFRSLLKFFKSKKKKF